MRSNINMKVSLLPPLASGRVLFGTDENYAVAVEGQKLTVLAGKVQCDVGATLAGSDLLNAIRDERANNPVLNGAVSDPNIEDGAVTIAKVDPSSTPLPVSSGGTGLASVADGALLVGATTTSLSVSRSAAWNASSNLLEVTETDGVTLGDARIAIDTDAYGARSLFSFDATGRKTNMVAPGVAAPEVDGGINYDSATKKLSMTPVRGAGYPVDAFFAWSDSPTTLNRESVVSPGRNGVTRSGRVRFRGTVAEYDGTVAEYDGTAPTTGDHLFGVLRDARGTCSKVATGIVP